MTEQWTSALSFSSFAAPNRPDGTPAGTDRRREVEDIAMRWQSHSSYGLIAGLGSDASLVKAGAFNSDGRQMINRVVEIHGVAGSIGEQLTLAWAAEQEVQRFQSPEIDRDVEHVDDIRHAQRMAVRALCEMSTHFLLGATHGLANLILRVLLCNTRAAVKINTFNRNKAQGFEPGSDLKQAWPTFSPTGDLWAKVLPAAADESGLKSLKDLVAQLNLLREDARFQALEERRGMDYHRHRPQSLAHTSPRSGIWSTDTEQGISTMTMSAASADVRRDETVVHDICRAALTCVSLSMRDLDPMIGAGLGACHLVWGPTDVDRASSAGSASPP
jgi:hypothetical protein